MDKVGVGGLLALGWLVLAVYVMLLLVISAIITVKGALESLYETVAVWYRGAPAETGLITKEVDS